VRLDEDPAFLAHRLWVDPCADAILTDPRLDDGSFNPIDRGYRHIHLNQAQFLVALGKSEPPGAEASGLPEPPPLEESRHSERDATASKSPAERIKRKGGRSAPWVKHLKKYLQLRLKRGDDILPMTLKELRADFSGHATLHKVRLPGARSSLDEQIKRARLQVVAEHQERSEPDHDNGLSMDEIMSVPEIRRK
jgi:hypothetical protein